MNDGIIIEVGMIHKLKELGVTNAAVIMLYGKILTMSEDTGYCTATNTYFANLLAKTPRGIQKYILELKTRGIIKVETKLKKRMMKMVMLWKQERYIHRSVCDYL